MNPPHDDLRPRRPIREVVAYFLRLGTLGFGGPVALVGLMEKELVQDRGWLTNFIMGINLKLYQALETHAPVPLPAALSADIVGAGPELWPC